MIEFMHLHPAHKSGFSLLQVAVLLSVASILVVSILPGGSNDSDVARDAITVKRMQAIEEASRAFMAANLRRPCPADPTLSPVQALFGREESSCTSYGGIGGNIFTSVLSDGANFTAGSKTITTSSGLAVHEGSYVSRVDALPPQTYITKQLSGTSYSLSNAAKTTSSTLSFNSVVAGGVPVRELGLPDEYAIDGFGRRIIYAVDIRATQQIACRDMQSGGLRGDVRIRSTNVFTGGLNANTLKDQTMWALLSTGRDGYGSFPASGSAYVNRLDTGSTDDDTLANSFAPAGDLSGGLAASNFDGVLVQKEKTTSYDDTVWYQDSTKNVCCVGKACNMGVFVAGTGQNITSYGDINGDGINDMVIGDTTNSRVMVIYGAKYGWPMPPNTLSASIPTNGSGIVISTISNLGSLAVGDFNNDGYADIAIGTGNGSGGLVRIFRGSATPASTTYGSISEYITLGASTGSVAPKLAVGDFNRDGKKDLLILNTATAAYVVYGAASMTITPESSALLASTTGFKISANGTSYSLDSVSGIGDVNNSGYDDIIISGYSMNPAALYLLFDRSSANWNSDVTTAHAGSSPGTPDEINIATNMASGTKQAMFIDTAGNNTGRYTITVADLKGRSDGQKDIIFNSGNYYYVYYGKTGTWGGASINMTSSANYNYLTTGFRVDAGTVYTKPLVVGDIDANGFNDILISDPAADNGATNTGSVYALTRPASGWISNTFTLASSYTTRIDGGAVDDAIFATAITDLNYDGQPDIMIGAPGHGSNAGFTYIMFGRKVVPWSSVESMADFN